MQIRKSKTTAPFKTINLAIALCLFQASASQGRAAEPNQNLDSASNRAALTQIEDLVNTTYVVKELRPTIILKLEKAWKDGRYETNDPDLFARKITEDLEEISHDGHLYLSNDPARYRAEMAPAKSDDGLEAFRRNLVVRTNSGLSKMEILPGNLRYLRIDAFRWTPGISQTTYDFAINFLKEGEAMIVEFPLLPHSPKQRSRPIKDCCRPQI